MNRAYRVPDSPPADAGHSPALTTAFIERREIIDDALKIESSYQEGRPCEICADPRGTRTALSIGCGGSPLHNHMTKGAEQKLRALKIQSRQIALPLKPTRLADGLGLEVSYEKRPIRSGSFRYAPCSATGGDLVPPCYLPASIRPANNFGRHIINERVSGKNSDKHSIRSEKLCLRLEISPESQNSNKDLIAYLLAICQLELTHSAGQSSDRRAWPSARGRSLRRPTQR